jgi:hypothetical protein
MRTIPERSLSSVEEISKFLRTEILELQNSDDDVREVSLRISTGEPGESLMEERVVTLKVDRYGGGTVTLEGLLKNPVRMPMKKSAVGPTQMLRDELDGTFQLQQF